MNSGVKYGGIRGKVEQTQVRSMRKKLDDPNFSVDVSLEDSNSDGDSK